SCSALEAFDRGGSALVALPALGIMAWNHLWDRAGTTWPKRAAAHAAAAAARVAEGEVDAHPFLGEVRDVLTWVACRGRRDEVARAEQAAQAELVREVFGNACRPTVVAPAWLAWEGGLVGRLARGLFDEGAFDPLPVMADALEEAGCTDEGVLAH